MRGSAKAWLTVAVGLLLAFGALAPSPALAAPKHHFLETFGSVAQPSFAAPKALALDPASHDLLVIDRGLQTLSRFKPNGEADPFSALGTNVIDGKAGGPDATPQDGFAFGGGAETQVAVAPLGSVAGTAGDIYVIDISNGVVDVFAPSGAFLGQLTQYKEGPTAAGPLHAFAVPCGVAVDPNGAVYVGDFNNGQAHKYVPAANPPVNADSSANYAHFHACTLAAGTGASAGFIFSNNPLITGELTKIDSEGAEEGETKYVVSTGNTTVTVDPASGNVLAATGSEVNEFDASGATEAVLKTSFSLPSKVQGVAVDATTGNIYVDREGGGAIEVWGPLQSLPVPLTGKATAITNAAATLNGTVNPEGQEVSECRFEYGEAGQPYEHSVPCAESPAEIGPGESPVAVHADVTGLSGGSEYRFRLSARNGATTVPGADGTFRTAGPLIGPESVSQIATTSATLEAKLDPEGKATAYRFEYVSDADFQESGYNKATSLPLPPAELGPGSEFVEVAQALSGLAPDTAYHFRLAASNLDAAVKGPDTSFATFAPPPAGLPDGRAYEMISPPQKAGEVIPPEPASNLGGSCGECLPGQNRPTMPMQSAPDGEAVLYEGQPFSSGLAAGTNEYVSTRTAGGWGTQSLSEPTTTGTYEAFSADLSHSVLFQISPTLSPQAPIRGGKDFANLYLQGEGGPPQPLISEEPPHRDPGFPSPGGNQFRTRYAGANSGAALELAFSHLIFEANDALTGAVPDIAPKAPEVEAGEECTLSKCNLYEWFGGQLRLINVLPGNAGAAPNAVIGSGRLLSETPESETPDVDQAISADGSRIFWSAEASGQVYVRIDGEKTLQVPGPGSCKKSVPRKERACFLTASPDGSAVLLSDGQIFELNEAGSAYLPTANLSEGEGGLQGILGASEDLSRVYFIDTKALTEEGEVNANEEHAEAGKLNLYAWSEGAASFIGALLPTDNTLGTSGRYGTWKPARTNRTAQVSADGSYLAFMSQASLQSGYDNAANFEVYEYAAGPETLTCASCDPSGQQPLGPSNLSLLRSTSETPPFPQPGNLSADGHGRLFFESQDALSPQDTNGTIQDVYEWEPNGVGGVDGCHRAGGCVYLISSGHTANDSMFLDSSASGNDAFFITRQQLLPRDKDQQLDLYDARAPHVPGEALGFAEAEAPPCLAEACKGPFSSAPGQQSPGTATFEAEPHEPPPPLRCRKGFVKRRGTCVKQHKARKRHKRHAKRTGHNRGGAQ